jgi:hypothetical protein
MQLPQPPGVPASSQDKAPRADPHAEAPIPDCRCGKDGMCSLGAAGACLLGHASHSGPGIATVAQALSPRPWNARPRPITLWRAEQVS